MDTILVSKQIITMDKKTPLCTAVGITGDTISWLGSAEEVSIFRSPGSKIINLGEATIMPGFNDAHTHTLLYGLYLNALDCSPAAVDSIAAIKKNIKDHIERSKLCKDDWVIGWGYNDDFLHERRHPLKEDLDFPNPVVIFRTCTHACTVNRRALELAGIDSLTPNLPRGQIQRTLGGEPTGLILEEAQYLIKKAIAGSGGQALVEWIAAASRQLVKSGITSTTEAAIGYTFAGEDELRAYILAQKEGKLPIRVNMNLQAGCGPWLESGIITGFGDEQLRIGAVKFFTDGAISLKTAFMREPYQGCEERGALLWEKEELFGQMEQYHRKGWQITCHAIGDAAIETVLEGYQYILERFPRRNHRHRIEHFALPAKEDIERAKALEVIVIPQATFFEPHCDKHFENLGEKRMMREYPLRSLLENGLFPAGSSDLPCVIATPLKAMQGAVLRRTRRGKLINPEEALTPLQALETFTVNSAYSTFEEHRKGSLSVGKLADLVALDRDPTSVEPEALGSLKVLMTIVGGNIVYES